MYILYLIVLLSIGTVYSGNVYIDYPVANRSRWYNWHRNEDIHAKKFAEWAKNRYQISGITTEFGDLCIDNCVDGTCYTGFNYKDRFACKVVEKLRNETAPVYFTTRKELNHHVCLTRCGKYNERYEWCLIDKENHWDYCSTEIYTRKYDVHLTTDGQYCKNQCKRYTGGFFCKNALDEYKSCVADKNVSYIPARTIYGNICMGKCSRYRPNPTTRWSYRCYDINKKYTECAPPGQEFSSHIEDIFYELYRKDLFEYEIPYY